MDEPRESILFERDGLEAAARQLAQGAAEELGGLLGTTIEMSAQGAKLVLAKEVADDNGPIVMVLCRSQGTPGVPIQLVVPRSLGAVLAGFQLGHELEECLTAGKSALNAEMLGALRGSLKIFVTSLREALGETLDAEIQIQDALEVEEPASDPTWLDGDRFWRVRLGVQVDGAENAVLDVLLPGVDAADGSQAGEEPLQVVVIDDDPDSIDVDGLSRDLGLRVEAADFEGFEVEYLPNLEDWDAVLIPWQLGGALGIESVERLAERAGEAETPIVVVHPRPTRSMVMSALRAGASSFLMEISDLTEFLRGDSESGTEADVERPLDSERAQEN